MLAWCRMYIYIHVHVPESEDELVHSSQSP
jgi:hypothetical protein